MSAAKASRRSRRSAWGRICSLAKRRAMSAACRCPGDKCTLSPRFWGYPLSFKYPYGYYNHRARRLGVKPRRRRAGCSRQHGPQRRAWRRKPGRPHTTPPPPPPQPHPQSQRTPIPPPPPRPCDPSCCRRRRSLCAIALCGLALCHGAQAEPYPARSVEIIVPWAVGGGSDAVARAFADAATRLTGQSFVVINRPGASGAIGHQEGAAARADGYKLTMVTPEVSLAYLQGIGKTQWSDFQYVARINIDPIALVVKADAPWSTLEQFTDYARSHPGLASISNSGVGATYHLAAIALEKKTGLSFNNVPYIGAAPAVMGLLSGQVDAALATTGEVG